MKAVWPFDIGRIDRLSHKYIGQPYPMRTDRVVFLVAPERAWAQSFG